MWRGCRRLEVGAEPLAGSVDGGGKLFVAASFGVLLLDLSERKLGDRIVQHAARRRCGPNDECDVVDLDRKLDQSTRVARDDRRHCDDHALAVGPPVESLARTEKRTLHQIQPVTQHPHCIGRAQHVRGVESML